MSRQFIESSPVLGDAGARQLAAQNTAVSVWVAASAGAGKTRVLINRMMRLLLEGASPQSILALTYTRAAAMEMANRLIGQARDLAGYSDEARKDFVQALLGETPPAALQRARSLYEDILEVPGGLQIQTIHAFCQSLLGRFPFEAGLTPGFEPIEEDARERLLDEALEKTLTQGPYRHLKSLAKSDKLRELAGALVRVDWDAFPMDQRISALEQALGGNLAGQSVQGMRDQFRADLDGRVADMDALLSACAAPPSKKTAQNFAQDARAALGQDDPFPGLQAATLTKKGEVNTNLAKTPECRDSPIFAWLVQRLQRQHDRLQALNLYDLNLDVLAFGQGVSAVFQALKAAQGVLDFDDLIAGAGRLLSTANGPSYVQYRLDQQISHILVDEAQDTSTPQWQVIASLAEPFFDDASQMDNRPRTLFVVGDFKQSIYSFQGANPRLFQEKREGFQALAGPRLETVEMVHSFRSAPTILGFVDALAQRIAGGQGAGKGAGQGHGGLEGVAGSVPAHAAVQQARPGRVEIWPAPQELGESSKVDWQPLRAAHTLAPPRAILGQSIARHIHRLCYSPDWADQPAAYLALGRRVQPGDFLILLQNRKAEFADALIAELKALRVPVTGVDRLKVVEELLVQDLLALGDICLQPGDDLALAALLKSPFYALDEQAIYDLAVHRGQRSLMTQLADQRPDLHDHFLRLRGQVGRRSVYEFYAAYLFADGMRAQALAALGPEGEDILTVFLDRARAFDQIQNGDLLGFIEGERRSTGELKRDSSQSAGEVRLMTVHGAKGLEAPIVILPDLRDPHRPGGARTDDQLHDLPGIGPLWTPSKGFDVTATAKAREDAKAQAEKERERLFYVAVTRAEERLIIATDKSREDKGGLYTWFNKARDVVQDQGKQEDLALEELGWGNSQGWAMGAYPRVNAHQGGQGLERPNPLPDWIKTAVETPEGQPKTLNPSALFEHEDQKADQKTDPEPTLRPNGGRALALQRGVLVHAALEHLPADQPTLWPGRLSQFFGHAAPDVPQGERASWTGEVIRALKSPELAAFFGPNSRSEVTVSGVIEGRPALGQIDRLWIDAASKTVHILDYKTNRPPRKQRGSNPRVLSSAVAGLRQSDRAALS